MQREWRGVGRRTDWEGRISSIDQLDDFPDTDIVLLTSPYGSRPPIFNSMKGMVKGIYCEKPFAKSVNEHIEIILLTLTAAFILLSVRGQRCR